MKDISQLDRNELLQILHNAQDCIVYLEKMQETLNSDTRIYDKQNEKEAMEKEKKELQGEIRKKKTRIANPAQFNFGSVILKGVVLFGILRFYLDIALFAAVIMAVSGGMALEFILLASKKRAEENGEYVKELNTLEEKLCNVDRKITEINTEISTVKAEQEGILSEARAYCDSKHLDEIKNIIPENYFSQEDLSFLCQILENRRADSWKEAINLYEDYLYKLAVEERQEKQLDLSKQTARMQQESLNELRKQNDLAKKQLAASKDISRSTRQTRNADRVNALINLIKK